MVDRLRIAGLTAWVVLAAAGWGIAAATIPPTMTNAQRQALQVAENFFKLLNQVKINFNQRNPDGSSQTGTIDLDRERSSMRIEYDDNDDVLILIKNNILEQIMTKEFRVFDYPLSATPARFLVRKDFSFADQEIEVVDVREIAGRTQNDETVDIYEISVKESDAGGLLVLYFVKETGFLVRWLVQQPSGEAVVIDVMAIKRETYRRNDPRFSYNAIWYRERD